MTVKKTVVDDQNILYTFKQTKWGEYFYEVTKWDDSIFKNDIDLHLEIPDEIEGIPVTYIKEHSFEVNKINSLKGKQRHIISAKLVSIKIPSTVKEIGYNAFVHRSYLKRVVMPEGLERIDSGVFQHCTSLKKINIPSSVNAICKAAFYGAGLETLSLKNSVECIIEDFAFDTKSLESVYIPKTIKYIGSQGFDIHKNATITLEHDKIPDEWDLYWCGECTNKKIRLGEKLPAKVFDWDCVSPKDIL